MKPALYTGTIGHERFLPRSHRFQYRFFMWFLPLDDPAALPRLAPWFTTSRWALNRYHRPDYLGSPGESHGAAVRRRMQVLTGKEVEGSVYGLLNLRTLGLYFSPVNFYFGFDRDASMSHFLAEVSNIPWNERHTYGYYVGDGNLTPTQHKEFHVSPFNPQKQNYQWFLQPPGDDLAIGLNVDDERGHIFEARLQLRREPLTAANIRRQLLRKPVMTLFIVAGIYYQAARLFFKKVPYIPYQKEAI